MSIPKHFSAVQCLSNETEQTHTGDIESWTDVLLCRKLHQWWIMNEEFNTPEPFYWLVSHDSSSLLPGSLTRPSSPLLAFRKDRTTCHYCDTTVQLQFYPQLYKCINSCGKSNNSIHQLALSLPAMNERITQDPGQEPGPAHKVNESLSCSAWQSQWLKNPIIFGVWLMWTPVSKKNRFPHRYQHVYFFINEGGKSNIKEQWLICLTLVFWLTGFSFWSSRTIPPLLWLLHTAVPCLASLLYCGCRLISHQEQQNMKSPLSLDV